MERRKQKQHTQNKNTSIHWVLYQHPCSSICSSISGFARCFNQEARPAESKLNVRQQQQQQQQQQPHQQWQAATAFQITNHDNMHTRVPRSRYCKYTRNLHPTFSIFEFLQKSLREECGTVDPNQIQKKQPRSPKPSSLIVLSQQES